MGIDVIDYMSEMAIYIEYAKISIDKKMGDGYAEKHPELVVCFVGSYMEYRNKMFLHQRVLKGE